MESPIELARQMARLLQSDPVATAQIQEHIKPEDLYELLRLEAPDEVPESVEDKSERGASLSEILSDYSKSEIIAAIADRK